ncbi:zinc-ribbon and DUF3426 domain-containing protein [Dyella caseinilytica]|uniref:DUF3426 domain-containing protein n=1 Tax=Dyella caseinilytica TaxID=1849581 RepID=A0ABX7GW15_9GAMM|nr:zinc-ribbon and DUF3426 domain-containing protein [Dyella caseinilytica]QRN54153.1 DUF3426 domain-containing protein [Dyella caseinilytica]GFZ91958.1 hypothetical protein GCM10011408_09250 [Dyella caseinilytica]
MYTQCPECLSVFSVDARTIAQAHGFVMCGHCGAGFDCISTLAEQLPPEPFNELPSHEPGVEPPRLESVVYRPQPDAPQATPQDEPQRSIEDEFASLVVTPRFARDRDVDRPRRWPWVLACSLLLLGLAAQLAWALREPLISDPSTGPLLREACAMLQCQLPPVRDVGKLRLLARDVQTHPTVPGALLISATLRNDAAFTQPWPVVTIRLSDGNGKVIAMRRLNPDEYLDDADTFHRGLAPGANSALVFEVEDPGHQAVAFDLGFE